MGYVLGLAGDMCAAARDDDVTQFKTCEEMRMKWGKYDTTLKAAAYICILLFHKEIRSDIFLKYIF